MPARPAVLKAQRIARPLVTSKRKARTWQTNDATWRAIRASVLRSEPLCRHCAARGVTNPATDVDHADGDPTNNAQSNLQPLCRPCHSRKTAIEDGGFGNRRSTAE